MTVSLTKGGNVNLSKSAPTMTLAHIGLGWNPRTTDGVEFDLDASAIMLGADGKALDDKAFIFYNNLTSPDGSVSSTGDNRTGSGEGDDETIKVKLSEVPANCERIVFVASIDQADQRGQNFGQVNGAYIRVYNGEAPDDKGQEFRYDLGEEASTETALVFGEVYRKDGEWKFKAIGQGYSSGLAGVVTDYGIQIG